MNKDILNTGIQYFINKNLNTDISSLLLKYPQIQGIDSKLVIEQIESKNKCKDKLPTWHQTPGIYYPNKLNIEQCSSEKTAHYKSRLVSGKKAIDLTGGFGVDSYYLAQQFESFVHCEINRELSEIASYNLKILGVDNIECLGIDGMTYLEQSTEIFDTIYIDPSRRDRQKKKVFLLEDCTPDIGTIYPYLLSKASTVLVKVSPLIDISKTLETIPFINEIHIVAVENQVKELLLLLRPQQKPCRIISSNIDKTQTQEFTFNYTEEPSCPALLGPVGNYVYEPNAAILKSGSFKLVARRFELFKLHTNTHLYSSDQLITFPGRRFKVNQIIPYNKQGIKSLKNISKANISCRNFPLSVETLRKKLKIGDGGQLYLFFTTDSNDQKIVLYCEKV